MVCYEQGEWKMMVICVETGVAHSHTHIVPLHFQELVGSFNKSS